MTRNYFLPWNVQVPVPIKEHLQLHELLDSVKPNFSAPDVSATLKEVSGAAFNLAGIFRPIKMERYTPDNFSGTDHSGSVNRLGVHLSTVINLGRAQYSELTFVYGEGIENYMQDAPNDVGNSHRKYWLNLMTVKHYRLPE